MSTCDYCGVRLEHGPREPKMVAVDWRKLSSSRCPMEVTPKAQQLIGEVRIVPDESTRVGVLTVQQYLQKHRELVSRHRA